MRISDWSSDVCSSDLSILSSLDQPTAGVAWVAGHDLLTMGEKERVTFRRSSVGFVWQQTSRNLVPYFTAAENIAAAHAISGEVRGSARRARVRELLDLLEVSPCADRLPTEMSGGQQQRVATPVMSEERRGGKEGVRMCSTGWEPV